MKKLISGVVVLVFVCAPMAFAVDDLGDLDDKVPKKAGLYCFFYNHADEIVAVAIPEKDAVMKKCKEIGGDVLERGSDGKLTRVL